MPQVAGKLAFDVSSQDMTAAHAEFGINIPNGTKFVQAWCDGAYDGISVKLISTGNPSTYLRRQIIIPVIGDPKQLYLTNDVRSGRTQLVLYFVFTDTPLALTQGGQDITLAEQVVRAGSIDTYDRRGEIIFQDSFEKGLPWDRIYIAGGVGNSITCSTDMARNGRRSCKLVTANAMFDYSEIEKHLHYVYLSPHGLEVSFMPTTVAEHHFTLNLYDGVNYSAARVRYRPVTTSLEIMRPPGAWDVLDAAVNLNTSVFHTLKVVADFQANRFVRIILDNLIFNLPTRSLFRFASANLPQLVVTIYVNTQAAANKTVYVDDVIVTKNEPA